MNQQETILHYLNKKDSEKLKELVSGMEELPLLQLFSNLSADEKVIVFRLLPKDKALILFEDLTPATQQHLLRSFTDERATEFVNEMAPDVRVRLLDELPATVTQKLLQSLAPDERAATNLLLGYEAETAGRLMTPEFITLKKDMTVNQALEKVRMQAKEKETIYTLYVTDQTKTLEGVLSLKDLLMAQGDQRISEIMSQKVIYVTTDTDQEEAESVAAVAIFIPLIMDMGGNVGTQSSTVFVRGMSLGHIDLSTFTRHFFKEVWIGLSLGLIVGIISGTAASLWQGIPMLGVAVGISLVFAMTLAAALGFLVPFVLIKLNIDQAAGSAPIITSIKDIAGLFIYFVSVNVLLGHLL